MVVIGNHYCWLLIEEAISSWTSLASDHISTIFSNHFRGWGRLRGRETLPGTSSAWCRPERMTRRRGKRWSWRRRRGWRWTDTMNSWPESSANSKHTNHTQTHQSLHSFFTDTGWDASWHITTQTRYCQSINRYYTRWKNWMSQFSHKKTFEL